MNRNITNKINYILDNIVPPALRDSRFFTRLMFRAALGKKYKAYMRFKDEVPHLSEDEISAYYSELADTFMDRDTDINGPCLRGDREKASGFHIRYHLRAQRQDHPCGCQSLFHHTGKRQSD